MKTKMTCLRLPETIAAALEKAAAAEDRPVAYIIKRAVSVDLKKRGFLKPENAK